MVQWWRILLPSRRPRFHPWIWKIPWRRKWQPTPGITSSTGVYYSKNTPNILAWKIPQKEGPGGLQSMESQRLRHDWLSANIREIQTLIVASVPSGCRSWGDRVFEVDIVTALREQTRNITWDMNGQRRLSLSCSSSCRYKEWDYPIEMMEK